MIERFSESNQSPILNSHELPPTIICAAMLFHQPLHVTSTTLIKQLKSGGPPRQNSTTKGEPKSTSFDLEPGPYFAPDQPSQPKENHGLPCYYS